MSACSCDALMFWRMAPPANSTCDTSRAKLLPKSLSATQAIAVEGGRSGELDIRKQRILRYLDRCVGYLGSRFTCLDGLAATIGPQEDFLQRHQLLCMHRCVHRQERKPQRQHQSCFLFHIHIPYLVLSGREITQSPSPETTPQQTFFVRVTRGDIHGRKWNTGACITGGNNAYFCSVKPL